MAVAKKYEGDSGEYKFQIAIKFEEKAFSNFLLKDGKATEEDISNLLKNGTEDNVTISVIHPTEGQHLFRLANHIWDTEIYTRIMPQNTPLALAIFNTIYKSIANEKARASYKQNPPSFGEWMSKEFEPAPKPTRREQIEKEVKEATYSRHHLDFKILNLDIKVEITYSPKDAKKFFDEPRECTFEDFVVKSVAVNLACNETYASFINHESFMKLPNTDGVIDKVIDIVRKHVPEDEYFHQFTRDWNLQFTHWMCDLYNSYKKVDLMEKEEEKEIKEEVKEKINEKVQNYKAWKVNDLCIKLCNLYDNVVELVEKEANLESWLKGAGNSPYLEAYTSQCKKDIVKLRCEKAQNKKDFLMKLDQLKKLYR